MLFVINVKYAFEIGIKALNRSRNSVLLDEIYMVRKPTQSNVLTHFTSIHAEAALKLGFFFVNSSGFFWEIITYFRSFQSRTLGIF